MLNKRFSNDRIVLYYPTFFRKKKRRKLVWCFSSQGVHILYLRLKSVEVYLEASSYAAASLKLIRGTEEALNKQASSSVLYMFDMLRKIVAMFYIVLFERYMVCHLVNLGKTKRVTIMLSW